ncbi:MAG: hypothetical protein CVU61_14465 [Deltaproteobacteria bacterium HGW-Deltaproteobacteria-19]|nr:MAG: hypothetical protein CVU61_14465 [Deltaproteobacteria bacterium HGW-Deltaproteobacteria-19]
MMEKKYVRPIAVLLPVDLFTQVQEYTTERKISFSAFLRDAIKRKLSQDRKAQEKKEHQFDGFSDI